MVIAFDTETRMRYKDNAVGSLAVGPLMDRFNWAWAHRTHEYRGGNKPNNVPTRPNNPAKKKPCHFMMKFGSCKKGDKCPMSHDIQKP